MDNPDSIINGWAQRSHGVVTREILLRESVSQAAIRTRLEKGTLVPVHPGVYHHAAASVTSDSRLLAAVLAAGEGAVASHRSAAWLHGLRDVPRSRPEITSPRTDLPRLAGVIPHRTKLLEPADVTSVRGIAVTTVPRTLLDLGAVLPFEIVELAAQDAIIRKLTSEPHLLALLERVGRRGRNGTAVLRAVVAQALPDERLETVLEGKLHALIQRSALPTPVLQHPVGGYVVDFAWPGVKRAAEADGRRWHATRKDFEKGLVRDRALRAMGWTVDHFGWTDVVERSADVITYLNRLAACSVSLGGCSATTQRHRTDQELAGNSTTSAKPSVSEL